MIPEKQTKIVPCERSIEIHAADIAVRVVSGDSSLEDMTALAEQIILGLLDYSYQPRKEVDGG
jgi:hypothetical protein